ncbi:sulfotransferase [Portibacter marinus]|uniref:sulfotransferase n=1 Tax=Portibacter marinus TaxID=2898660 RepID=UPI001F259FE1|nr:sulfotransferase [Portibacter marinus]
MKEPTFLIIGERRSGTTTLARWIEDHPEIYLNPKMDLGYFIDSELVGSKKYQEGKVDYEIWGVTHSREEYLDFFKNANTHKAIGEKSADYFFWHQSHQRIKNYFPDIKLLVTLRNPIERAWSMYWNEVGKGRESLSFSKAIRAESKRIESSDYARDHLSYVTRGFYDRSLQKLFEVFDPQNVLVTILEKAKIHPSSHLKSIYSFLDVNTDIGYSNVDKKYNRNWTMIQKPVLNKVPFFKKLENKYFYTVNKLSLLLFRRNIYRRRNFVKKISKPFRNSKEDFIMKKEDREYLEKIYSPHIKELEKMLDLDLGEWLKR